MSLSVASTLVHSTFKKDTSDNIILLPLWQICVYRGNAYYRTTVKLALVLYHVIINMLDACNVTCGLPARRI